MHFSPIDQSAPATLRRSRRTRPAVALAAAPVIVGLALPYWIALMLFVAGWLAIDSVRLVLDAVEHLGAVLGD